MTDAACRAGNAYPFGAPDFTSVFVFVFVFKFTELRLRFIYIYVFFPNIPLLFVLPQIPGITIVPEQMFDILTMLVTSKTYLYLCHDHIFFNVEIFPFK